MMYQNEGYWWQLLLQMQIAAFSLWIFNTHLSSKNKMYHFFVRYRSCLEQIYEITTTEHEANKAKVFAVHAWRHIGGVKL
jgi:hypothetical protein